MKAAKRPKLVIPETRCPRAESFIDMLHISIAPLLQKKSFTWLICSFDVIYYVLTLFLQLFIDSGLNYNPVRPTQTMQFYLGQLYPYYVQNEFNFWRLLLSLEMFRNEIHIFLALIFKLHFCSFVEHFLGWRKMCVIYLMGGISSTLAQMIYSNLPGVCGTFPLGFMVLAFQIQSKIICIKKATINIEKASPQEQLQYFYDYQLNQDVTHCLMKAAAMIYTIFGVLSVKAPQILFFGGMIFALQLFLLGNFFLHSNEQDEEGITMVVGRAPRSWVHFVSGRRMWLLGSCAIIMLELLILCFVTRSL